MIVWGWRTVFRVVGSGVFSCPSCGADRNYQRRKAQRFFTLFFIPLIPLKTLGEFIRCTYCKNDFRESVLARPTAAQFTDLLQNTVRGVMVHMLRAGGWDHPGVRAAAVHEIASAGAAGYGEPNLAQDMQVVPQDLSQMLASLAGQLPEAGREALLTGAVRVAALDGPVQPAERAVIDSVGSALGMSQAYVAGIVGAVAPGAVIAAQPQAPAWGAAAEAPAVPAAPGWGAAAEASASAAPAAPAPGASGMETMLIQAPQPAPATGTHDAIPPQAPASGGSGMETMLIQAPQPAPATGTHDAIPPQPPTPSSAMETAVIPIPPQPPTIPAPPPTMVDTSASMETMFVPIVPQGQQPPQPPQPADPANPAEDPAPPQQPINWPPLQQ
jgi:tellurite resistance protein